MELRIKSDLILIGKYKKMEVATEKELEEIIKVATEQLNKKC